MPQLSLKAQRQIQTDILTQLISELSLNGVNAGSVLDVLTNAIAQEDFAQYIQMAQIVRLVDLDAIIGDDLDNKAFEFGLERRGSRQATGLITILRPLGFIKVATTFYAGSPAPISGNTTIDVNDASSGLIGTSGTLIIGRGTSNEESVNYSVAPTNNINYFTFTLDSGLANDHAIEETVILSQGGTETILAGTQVRVPSTGTRAEIIFTTDNDTILLDGEDKVSNVQVTAVLSGSNGNIPIKAIEGTAAFVTAPFVGARAENNSRFTTGRDLESDDELRDRIRDSVQSLSRGVREAILNAIVGLVDVATAKRVVSANIVLPIEVAGPVKVYIDDGTGFEPSFLSRGFEQILTATGGEERVVLDLQPVVKAQIENNVPEPYDMSGGSKTLIYNVGTQSETISFEASDFEFPDSATAEEIITAINNKATLIEARTSQSGSNVTIQARININENIQITGGTANSILTFPTDEKITLSLFKNDVLLSKDGFTAFIDSQNSGPYDLLSVGAYPHELNIVVDGKTANPQTVTIDTVDVVDTSAVTVTEIVSLINAQLSGAVASVVDNGTKVRIVSNTKLSSDSAIRITGGSANDASDGLNFSTTQVSGIDGDYTFNRETGTIEFANPLIANDLITAGSQFTRAKLRASLSQNYAPANTETLVISVDGGSDQTITFDATFAAGLSAQVTADFINLQLNGATAVARVVGVNTFLEIRTNTFSSNGSIEIKSSSTANSVFGFTLDTVSVGQTARKAYKISSNTGPFQFRENDSLVVVLNNDIINSTFSILLDFEGPVSAATSTTIFDISSFSNIFTSDDDLNDFYLAFTDGPNTVTGVGDTLSDQGGDTWRIAFSSLPSGLSNIATGDLVKVTDFVNTSNNGFFLVTAVNTSGNGYIEITNVNGIAETGAAATVVMSERRIISDYTASSGQITVSSGFSSTPVVSNSAIVLPRTVNNVIDYLNNTKITSLSLKSDVLGVEQNTKIQISSKLDGSDGYIQITGGTANSVLGFNTALLRGLPAYDYYTGLLALVHKTIYGDDSDFVAFPGFGAAGITFQVLAPTVTEVSISINVTLSEGFSITSLENEIKSAISGYVNNLGVNDDVIIEEIRAKAIAISGVIDVVLNAPLANIVTAENEIARTRDSLITVG